MYISMNNISTETNTKYTAKNDMSNEHFCFNYQLRCWPTVSAKFSSKKIVWNVISEKNSKISFKKVYDAKIIFEKTFSKTIHQTNKFQIKILKINFCNRIQNSWIYSKN
jgi:hypothetical protein